MPVSRRQIDPAGESFAKIRSGLPSSRTAADTAKPCGHRVHDRGFACASHEGVGPAVLGRSAGAFHLDATFELDGAASLLWGDQRAIGQAGGHHNDDLLDPGPAGANALELEPGRWRLTCGRRRPGPPYRGRR